MDGNCKVKQIQKLIINLDLYSNRLADLIKNVRTERKTNRNRERDSVYNSFPQLSHIAFERLVASGNDRST